MEIIIVTFARDFVYLEYCLKSIDKFASGFELVTILIPQNDMPMLMGLFPRWDIKSTIRIKTMDEWPGAGFLHHEYMVMTTDQWRCGKSQFTCHIDSDCIFIEPVTPEYYLQDGKPILRYEEFDTLCARHPSHRQWEDCTAQCLPYDFLYETMRTHPEVYHIDTYARARERMREKTGEEVNTYIMRQKNSYPQTFCEFVTLGNVAMHDFHEQYALVRQTSDTPTPPSRVMQFHAPDPIDKSQDLWSKGRPIPVVPIEMIKSLGL